MNETSLEAYWTERLAFRLGRQAAQVLDDLYVHGPATRAELSQRTGLKIQCICGRVNELVQAGVVEEFEKVQDTETNKQVWNLRCTAKVQP